MQVGQWYDDGWISLYFRTRFEAPSDNPRFAVTFYNPDDGSQERILAVRQGANRLLMEETLPSQEVVTWIVPVSAHEGSEVDISLRTTRPFDHGGGDERKLGVVVTECRLVSDSGPYGED